LALASILCEAGHVGALHDPLFVPAPAPLTAGPYDFVTCTEATEHFHEPQAEFT
jgi:hypothetical protein